MEPIYRVVRREPGTPAVERVDQVRLLSPSEREQARREREERRAKVAKRAPAKEPREGVDYSA
jgi:hypothetical protein